MSSECTQEEVTSFSEEVMSATITILQMVSWSLLEGTSREWVLWTESVAEIRVQDSTIRVLVIATHKQIDIILVWEASKLV